MAKRAGLPPSSIAHFETGSRKPSFDTLRRLATALEVTTDYLLGRVQDPALAESGDPLFRDIGNLTGSDRDLAKDFLKVLAERNATKRTDFTRLMLASFLLTPMSWKPTVLQLGFSCQPICFAMH